MTPFPVCGPGCWLGPSFDQVISDPDLLRWVEASARKPEITHRYIRPAS